MASGTVRSLRQQSPLRTSPRSHPASRAAPTLASAAVASTLLPDPEPRPLVAPVISVDDHLIEPPDLFEGRMPGRPGRPGPRRPRGRGDGAQSWRFEGRDYPNVGLNAVVGRPREEWSMEPARFDEMRPGCFDIEARVADMDIAGIWASLCFPSLVAGFCGAVFSAGRRPRARAWPAPGPGTAGTSRSGPAPTPSASSRSSSRGWPTRDLAAAEVRAQRRGWGSRR